MTDLVLVVLGGVGGGGGGGGERGGGGGGGEREGENFLHRSPSDEMTSARLTSLSIDLGHKGFENEPLLLI